MMRSRTVNPGIARLWDEASAYDKPLCFHSVAKLAITQHRCYFALASDHFTAARYFLEQLGIDQDVLTI